MSRFLTLNIGTSKAVLAEYSLKGKSSLTLTAYGEADLSVGGEGAILEMTLAPAIQRLMREKGIRPAPLVVALNGQMVFPRFAKFPNVSADKLEELVSYEVEQNVPFPIDEIVYDHQFTGETVEGDRAAMIVAAKVEQVREVTDAIMAAGLTPEIVDVAPMAVYNAFKWSNPNATGCSVILDIGAKTTNLILVEGEKIYNRSIPVAGNTITREISQAFGCSIEEAEELKCQRGYVSLGGVTEDADEVSDRLSKVIRAVFTRLHAEISRSINFYRSQQGGSAPERLFLTGGTVRLPQLDEFFRETLQVEIGYINPFRAIALGSKIDRNAIGNDAFTLAESAGLALRMTPEAQIKINLMPPEIIERARSVRRIPFVAAGVLSLLAAIGVGYYMELGQGAAARAKVEFVDAKNNNLKALEVKLKKAQGEELAERERCDRFQQLLLSRSEALRRLKALRGSLLPGMWVTAWEPLKEGNGAKVTIRGWKDNLGAIEAKHFAMSGNKKRTTAAEMVQNALRRNREMAADGVKIVAQREVKNCISEFALEMKFASAPTLLTPVANKKKGGR